MKTALRAKKMGNLPCESPLKVLGNFPLDPSGEGLEGGLFLRELGDGVEYRGVMEEPELGTVLSISSNDSSNDICRAEGEKGVCWS